MPFKFNAITGKLDYFEDGSSATFTSLTDTPSTYSGQGGKFVKVNTGETGLEFGAGIDIDFRDYSPAANGQKVSDAGITSGLATLTSATGLFVSGDVGKSCVVTGAGVAGANLHTTIAGYTNSTTITLTANASTTVSGANFSWGTDDTVKFQSAINDANTAGNGRVIIPINRYYTTGVLTLKRCSLVGAGQGPYDCSGSNPGKVTVGPTILITNETTAFFTDASWHEPKIENLIFYYPNQVGPSASIPVIYPWTIDITNPGVAGLIVRNCLFVNSYNAINSLGGRHLFENLNIGVLNRGIVIDGCRDTIRLCNLQYTPYWDTVNALGGGQPIDAWVLANSTALEIYSADLVIIENFFVLQKNIGIFISDSATYTSPFSNSYGVASNINMDGMNYGIRIKSTNPTASVDWEFSNIQLGASAAGDTAVWLEAGGTSAPKVTLMGGALWGPWSNPILTDAGNIKSYGVRGIGDTASASLTVKEIDGSPSYTSITTLQVPNTCLTQPSAGIARLNINIDPATFGIDGGAYSDTYISTANVDAGAY